MERDTMVKSLIEIAKDGNISCEDAFRLAERFNCSTGDIGEICNENKIKIRNCQLGCF